MIEVSNELKTQVELQVGELSAANTNLQEEIAGRKGAEDRLSESEEHYRNVAETATDAIITTDEDGRITFVNRAAERVFGYASADLFGLKLTMLMPEYLRHVHEASLKTYIATGNRQLEYWEPITLAGFRKGGNEIPVELSVSRFTKNDKHVFTCIVRDITEREAARESLLRLAAIVESSSEAIIGNTLAGTIITWNPGAERLFGYSAEEVIGRHLTIVVPADRAAEVPRLLERIGRGESAVHYETARLNKDGRQIDVSITVSPIQDSSGKIIGASTIARDIAEQKRAEEKLRESEEHYRNVAETATDAIITTDEEGGITSVNRAAERIFGHTSEDLLGQKLTTLIPEYLRHVHQASLKTYITTGDRQLEYWECIDLIGLQKGGQKIPVELSVSRFTKNDKHVFTCIVRDITERKKAQESLLRLAAIVESSSEAIIGNTLDGTIITWNPGAARLFGYRAEEAIGRHLTIVVPAGRVDEVPQLLEKIGRGDSAAYETVRLNKDGTRIDVSITVSPIQDSSGKIIGASTIARNIAEQKRAEEKLRESEEHYRNVAETATDAIITTDEESEIISVNRAAERIFGHGSEELLGQKLTSLMPEYLRHVHQESLKTYTTTGDRQLEYWECIELTGLKKGGLEIPVELSVSRFTKNDKHVFTCIVRDITERKQAHEALLRLAAIVESSSDAIIGNTLDGTIFTWNPGAEKLFGYTAREAIGRHISIVVPADRNSEVPKMLERIERSESIENYETRRLNREGEEIDVSVTVSPIKDGDGAVIGASTIVRDIGEQKRSEERIRESEEHYRNVAETATDAIITTDEESAITSVNRAAERIFEHRSEELLGQKLTSLLPEYLRHVHQASLKTYTTTGDRQLEYWECIELTGLKKGGLEIPVELSVSRFTKNDKHVFTCIVRDITDRKQAHESLLRLAAIVESSSDAIMGNTLDGTIFAWNPGAEKLFGYSASEAIGEHISIVIPADRKDEVPEILERIARSESTENQETVRLNKDGNAIDVSVTVSPIKDGNGAVIGASTIARDITEQKKAEAQLRALTADLLHSNRELQDFASVASHDLQEPLRKIQTFADDLAENGTSTLSSESLDTLKRIQSAAKRMQRLINDLLSLSRISSRAQPFVRVDLNNITREVLSDLEVRLSDTGGRVDLHDIPTIDAEPLQMRQLFQNLMGNALKFNTPGRVPIVTVRGELIDCEKGQEGGSTEAQPRQVCQITVEDNGIGFDEKYVDRIFAMFQRLHGRNEYEGTGMGLAICRRIAEHHGGTITARSTRGTGSMFIVRIPAKRAREETL